MINVKKTDDVLVAYPYIGTPFLFLFCGYVIIWYLQIGYRIHALGAIRFEFIYAAVLTVIAFLSTPKISVNSSLLNYVILYFIILVVQIPFSYDFDTSYEVFLDRIVKFSFMAFFIVTFVRSPRHLKYFLAAFLLACLKMGQEGIVGKITGSMLWENQGVMRLNGVTPMYAHPNSYSGMALGTLPFVYTLWPHVNKFCKIILAALGISALNIILYSASRTAYVGFLVLFMIIFYKQVYQKTNMIMATVFVVILFTIISVFIPHEYVERFDSIYTLKEKEGYSSEKRIQILEDALDIFVDHPFGVGVSAFPKIRMDRFERVQDTHNLYLQIATNLGIQGLIVFAMLIYKIYQSLFYVIDNSKKQINDLMVLQQISSISDQVKQQLNDISFISSVAYGVILFLTVRLVLGLFGHDLYEIYWWFSIGLTIALQNIIKCSSEMVEYYNKNYFGNSND